MSQNKLTVEMLQKLEEENGQEAILWLTTGDMSKDSPGADGRCWPDTDERGAIIGWFFKSNKLIADATKYVDHPTVGDKGYLEIGHKSPGKDIVVEKVKWPHYYLSASI